jgi:hypothetical protein
MPSRLGKCPLDERNPTCPPGCAELWRLAKATSCQVLEHYKRALVRSPQQLWADAGVSDAYVRAGWLRRGLAERVFHNTEVPQILCLGMAITPIGRKAVLAELALKSLEICPRIVSRRPQFIGHDWQFRFESR